MGGLGRGRSGLGLGARFGLADVIWVCHVRVWVARCAEEQFWGIPGVIWVCQMWIWGLG